MGQTVSRTPVVVRLEAAEAKEAMALYTLCWHGCPPYKEVQSHPQGTLPLYDSDDETTDAAVVSALAMTDPEALQCGQYQTPCARTQQPLHAPILQPLFQTSDVTTTSTWSKPPAGVPGHLARSTSAAGPTSPAQTCFTSQHPKGGKHAQQKQHRSKDITTTVSTTTAAARQHSVTRTRSAAETVVKVQQHSNKRSQGKHVVPLSVAALDAVGAPCRIGADLPPDSLLSHRASGADATQLRPYHHLHMMQLHKQRRRRHQQDVQQAACAPVQAMSVWGWHVAGSVPQVAS